MADELAMYQDRIRKVWHEGEWWFSAIDAANTETLLRIILSAPSPKAEPFKRWQWPRLAPKDGKKRQSCHWPRSG